MIKLSGPASNKLTTFEAVFFLYCFNKHVRAQSTSTRVYINITVVFCKISPYTEDSM